MLLDIGVNLAHNSFNQDRAAVLQRALEHGVEVIVITGTNLKASEEALALCSCNTT